MLLRTASSKASSKAPAVRALAVRQFTPNGVDSIEREAFVMGAFLKSASAEGESIRLSRREGGIYERNFESGG